MKVLHNIEYDGHIYGYSINAFGYIGLIVPTIYNTISMHDEVLKLLTVIFNL